MSETIPIPDTWALRCIGDVADLHAGYGFPMQYQGCLEGDLPFFKVGDISEAWQRNERMLTMAKHYLSFADAATLRTKPLPAGSVVFAKIGAAISLNRRALLSQPSLIDNNCLGLAAHDAILDSLFLFYFTCTLRLGESSRASVVPSLRKSDVEPIRIPLPPLNEQRRIVSKIEELFSDLDAAVVALERAKANLKRYRASVLKAAVEGKLTEAWRAAHPSTEPASKLLERILIERRQKWEADQLAKFAAAGKEPPKNWRDKYIEPTPPDTTVLPELPDSWCWASVEQTSEVQGGIQKQPKRTPAANSFPFLRVANVHRNRLELDEIRRIELFGEELERLRLQPDDLLVVEGNGSKTEIGRSAIWRGEIENCVHQNHIIRVRFLAGSSRYLNAYWNSPSGNGRVMEQAASTSGLYTLSVTKVCALPLPLAPLTEQQEIVEEVEQRLSVIAAAEMQVAQDLRRSDRLRQSILKQAFEGKLVPQDPRDEPASTLLARLAQNRIQVDHSATKPKTARRKAKS